MLSYEVFRKLFPVVVPDQIYLNWTHFAVADMVCSLFIHHASLACFAPFPTNVPPLQQKATGCGAEGPHWVQAVMTVPEPHPEQRCWAPHKCAPRYVLPTALIGYWGAVNWDVQYYEFVNVANQTYPRWQPHWHRGIHAGPECRNETFWKCDAVYVRNSEIELGDQICIPLKNHRLWK